MCIPSCPLYGKHIFHRPVILKWPSWSVNFISLVTSCVRLLEEEPQTAHLMSITWVSHIAANMLMGHYTLTQSIHRPVKQTIDVLVSDLVLASIQWPDLICTTGLPDITSGGPMSLDLVRTMRAHSASPDGSSLCIRWGSGREHQAPCQPNDHMIGVPKMHKSNPASHSMMLNLVFLIVLVV